MFKLHAPRYILAALGIGILSACATSDVSGTAQIDETFSVNTLGWGGDDGAAIFTKAQPTADGMTLLCAAARYTPGANNGRVTKEFLAKTSLQTEDGGVITPNLSFASIRSVSNPNSVSGRAAHCTNLEVEWQPEFGNEHEIVLIGGNRVRF
ncbi:hypothetical protein FHS89_002029 [Rubricella aquisinus]|uniref:Lipoprotein n=1 Tax=Rubricella aquisinus TaxID=2028108 RepID=A0A840WLS4_9RHOB|nr:hypothetical protein [Rubricella aquisinus]MBB5516009.1 hypothetical protein [Rubricella aquisinus]